MAIYLNPCWDGNVHTYVKTYERKKKGFTSKSENTKVAIGVPRTFILEIKPQKYIF